MRILPLRGPRLMQGDWPALDNAAASPGGRLGALVTELGPPLELFALLPLSWTLAPWLLRISRPVTLPMSPPALPLCSAARFCESCTAALGDWPAFETLMDVGLRHGNRCAATPISSSTSTPATAPTTTHRQDPHVGENFVSIFQPELCSFQVAITSAYLLSGFFGGTLKESTKFWTRSSFCLTGVSRPVWLTAPDFFSLSGPTPNLAEAVSTGGSTGVSRSRAGGALIAPS